jgi:hypothetical protein
MHGQWTKITDFIPLDIELFQGRECTNAIKVVDATVGDIKRLKGAKRGAQVAKAQERAVAQSQVL